MANILNIETSTTVCSVALSCDGEGLEHHEDYDGNNPSTMLSTPAKGGHNMLSIDDLSVMSVKVIEWPFDEAITFRWNDGSNLFFTKPDPDDGIVVRVAINPSI